MFYLKAVWLLEILEPQLLLNSFKSIFQAHVARTFTDISERSMDPFWRPAGALTHPFLDPYMSLAGLQRGVRGAGSATPLHADTTPPGLSQQRLLQHSCVMACKCLMGSLSPFPLQMAQVSELENKD